MRKLKVLSIMLILAVVLLVPTAGYATPGPVTNKYTETISPAGEDGKLIAVWQGIPDAGGEVVLPLSSSKVSLSDVSVKGAVLVNSQPEKVTIGENKGLRFTVRDVSSTGVELTATYRVPKLYAKPNKSGERDKGPRTRGDLIPFNYNFVNTSMPGIKEFELKAAVPAGHEPFAITAPAKAQVSQKDGVRWVTAKVKGKDGGSAVAVGGQIAMTFDYIPVGSGGVAATWVIIGVLSVLFLYYRRSMIPGEASGQGKTAKNPA